MLRLACCVGLVLLVACDGSSPASPDAAPAAPDAAPGTPDATPPPDAGAPDATPPPDAAPFVMSGPINLTHDTLTAGRTCAEAPQWSVVSLAATTATLSSAPLGDCLAAGDEVLLLDLQGTPSANANVGEWELLVVASVAGDVVTFAAARQQHYGAEAGSDTGIGTGDADQKVALVRVPRYGALTVAAEAVVTADAWDGRQGGVVALRAESIQVDGSLSAARLGYRGGRWSQDSSDCTQNVQTESGESFTGPPIVGAQANGGGAGGIVAAEGPLYNANSPISPSAGHATAGEPGLNSNGRTLGEPGLAYGQPGGARLTLGSGASGNLTCTFENEVPILSPPPNDHRAGGIVVVLGGEVKVGASGAITATPIDAVRDVAASGGYVYLRGTPLAVGVGRVLSLIKI
jgi:hypothetical protein